MASGAHSPSPLHPTQAESPHLAGVLEGDGVTEGEGGGDGGTGEDEGLSPGVRVGDAVCGVRSTQPSAPKHAVQYPAASTPQHRAYAAALFTAALPAATQSPSPIQLSHTENPEPPTST